MMRDRTARITHMFGDKIRMKEIRKTLSSEIHEGGFSTFGSIEGVDTKTSIQMLGTTGVQIDVNHEPKEGQ